jgi:hypothetical protein
LAARKTHEREKILILFCVGSEEKYLLKEEAAEERRRKKKEAKRLSKALHFARILNCLGIMGEFGMKYEEKLEKNIFFVVFAVILSSFFEVMIMMMA